MAQMLRGDGNNKSEQTNLLTSESTNQNRQQESSKHLSHDQLCESVHEKLISSDLATRNISSLTLQDGRRCLSMQERSSKSLNFPAAKSDH